ncbi:hypothetical protein NB537_17275 [Vibrio parahaemolyticus]|nr:hypothetical protein [Vibrio parahaemolyticus]MCR9656532.1 hypothetical protein [Vibrio parahaemolyticus]
MRYLVRQRFIVERTATVNQMRALLLEYGITVPVGRKVFERNLPSILEDADAENELPDCLYSRFSIPLARALATS